MSKTRTGRKGRARLAVAGHLELEKARRLATANGNGDGPSDDQNLFLDLAASTAEQAQLATDAASGVAAQVQRGLNMRRKFLAASDLAMAKVLDEESTFGDNELLDRLSALARGQGTGGELFSQGEVRPALPDAVDTADGAPGLFAQDSGDGTGPLGAGISGETSLAADADFPQLVAPFPHYYLTAAGTSATSSRGIAYLPSGPTGNFVPSNHGLGTGDTVSITIDVPQADLYAAGGEVNLGLSVIGNLTGKSIDADDPTAQGAARDIVTGSFSQFRQATAQHEIAAVTTITQAAGAELRVLDDDASTLLSIIFLADGQSIAGSTITGAAAGNATNYIVASATQIYVLEGGAAAGSNDSPTAVGDNIAAAVTAWNAVYGDMVTCSAAAGVLTWTMNKHRGSDGNAAGGVAANGALTVTGYVNRFGAGQTPLLGSGTEQWILQPQGGKAATAFIPFGIDAGDLNGVVGDTPAADAAVPFTNAQDDVNAANDVNIRIEGNKYTAAKINITVQVGPDTTTPRDGIAVAWSLTPA